jgi:hypothetical protein
MRERLKAFFDKKYAFLLIVIAGCITFIAFICVFQEKGETGSMWKDISGVETERKPHERLSNYEKIKRGLTETPSGKGKLLQRVELLKKKNFKTSGVEIEASNAQRETIKGKAKKANKRAKSREEEWFYNISNPDIVREEIRYRAVLRENQDVRPEKHIQIVLQEEIPSLSLEAGTILNGLPSLVGGRIHIKITSAKAGDKLISLAKYGLVCLDDPSLVVGLYNDDVAQIFAEASKKSVARELLDFGPAEVTRRIEKGMSLSDITKSITIEKGKHLFIAFPPNKKGKQGND